MAVIVQTYEAGVTKGQRDAVVMSFPVKMGRNTYEFYCAARSTYQLALEMDVCHVMSGSAVDPWLKGYGDGFDAGYVELCGLLGVNWQAEEDATDA